MISFDSLLTVGGLTAVVAGVPRPLLHSNPAVPPGGGWPTVLFWGLLSGVQFVDVVLLSVAAFSILVRLYRPQHFVGPALTLLLGLAALLLCLILFPPWRFGSGSRYVPAGGWYLWVTGGTLLSAVSAGDLLWERRRNPNDLQ